MTLPTSHQGRKAATVAELLERGMAVAVEVGECLEWQKSFSCRGATPCVKAKPEDRPPSDRYTQAFPVCRLLWEREHGPVPAGKLVYRKCCNNACVKLEHLKCGTRKEWARDRRKAGATKHKPTTLISLTLAARRRANTTNSIEKARTVRQMKSAGATYSQIAAEVDMSVDMVADVVRGKSWREIGGSPWAGLGARA